MDSTHSNDCVLEVYDLKAKRLVSKLPFYESIPQSVAELSVSLLEDGLYEFILRRTHLLEGEVPFLSIFSMEIEYYHVTDSQIVYRPRRTDATQAQIFQNYAGFSWFTLVFSNGTRLFSAPFDIQLKADNYSKLTLYLDFISKESPEYLFQRISPIRWASEASNGDADQIIEALDSALKVIEYSFAHIFQQPISKIEQVNKACSSFYGSRPNLVVEKLISSLTHKSIQEIENNPALVFEDLYKNTSTIENIMIYNWLINLLEFVNKNIEYDSNEFQIPVKCANGYDSLFSYIRNKYTSIQKNRTIRLQQVKQILEAYIWKFKGIFKISDNSFHPFYFTQKALTTPFYRDVFFEIDKWYSKNMLSLNMANFNYSMVRVDIIFELVCLIALKKYLQQKLQSYSMSSNVIEYTDRWSRGKETKAVNHISFNKAADTVDLYYEPSIYSNGDIARIGLNVIEAGVTLRKPDFIIRIIKNSRSYLIILDAKYSHPDVAFQKRLPNIVMKYLHGMQSSASRIVSIATMSICTEEISRFRSFHRAYSRPSIIIGNVSVSTNEINGIEELFNAIQIGDNKTVA